MSYPSENVDIGRILNSRIGVEARLFKQYNSMNLNWYEVLNFRNPCWDNFTIFKCYHFRKKLIWNRYWCWSVVLKMTEREVDNTLREGEYPVRGSGGRIVSQIDMGIEREKELKKLNRFVTTILKIKLKRIEYDFSIV